MDIILPAEGNTLAVEDQQTVIGNGDAMRVTTQVAKQLGRFAEGWLSVNDPLLSLQSMQQPGKQFPVLESGGRAAAVEPSVAVEVLQSKDELVAEDGAEHRDRQQDARV